MAVLPKILSAPSELWRRAKAIVSYLNRGHSPRTPDPSTPIPTTGSPPKQDQGQEYGPDDYAVFQPSSPRALLSAADRTLYWTSKIERRIFAVPLDAPADAPLYTLYRLYEYVVLDRARLIRNALEEFWRRRGPEWAVAAIPDALDAADPERYAVLAACMYLLMRSFNARVELGLDRIIPSILLPEEADMLKRRPMAERAWEKVPEWAKRVAPLEDLLVLPTAEGEVLRGRKEERAYPDFLAKNVLLWTPHIHFT